MKRIVAFALVLLLALTSAACSGSDAVNNTAGQAGNAGGPAEPANVAEDAITLTLWHIFPSSSDPFKSVVDEAVAKWNAENPTVQVKMEATENEAYKTKLKTAAAANELPDVFFSWGAGFSKPFAEGGKLLALDEYINDGTRDELLEGSLANLSYDGKVYGLPYTMYVGTFFVNQELFDQHGIKVPETYDELLEAVKAFRAKGIDPIAVGGKDLWPSMFYHNALALREGGAELSINALNGEASFEDPAFVRAAEKLQELARADAFMKGYMGITRDESEAVFITGTIPMYYNGSWVAVTLDSDDSAVKGKIRVMNFPMVEGADGRENEWIGGIVDTFMVSANTKYPEESVRFLKYLTKFMSDEGYKVGAGLPTWKTTEIDESAINPLLKDVVEMTKSATGIVPPWDVYLEGQQAEAHKNLVAELLADKITPEEFSAKMEALER